MGFRPTETLVYFYFLRRISMQPETNPKSDQLIQRIRNSLQKAERYTLRLRKTYTRLVVSGFVGSTATVLVAGGTAVQGPLVGSGIEGWRLACIVAALLSLIATVSVGLVQQLKLGERVPQGQLCIGRLRALDVALAVGGREFKEIAKEYEGVVKEFPEVI
jgi:hypothetical protein